MTSLLALFWDCEANRDKYLQDLNVKYILPYLLDKKIITEDVVDNLAKKQDSGQHVTDKVMKLLAKKNSDGTFDLFLRALRHENAYPWIADDLEEWKRRKLEHDNVLFRGVVPFPTMPDIGRKAMVDQVRQALCNNTCQSRSWIVIHGMLGIGKTVLASKALRDPSISQYYPGGIYWIAVGKAEEDNILLLKMQLLCDHFDKDYRADTVERCYRHLRRLSSDHERSLLILDDVWSLKVLEAFDIGWTVLVTTRDESVACKFSSLTTYISVTSGFTLEETIKYFATVLNCNKKELSVDAGFVHEKYKGNPLGISLMGSYMRKYGNDQPRWKKATGFETSGRSRRISSNTLSICRAVELSLEDLEDSLRNYYEYFALFPDDLYIKRKVFDILWDKSGIDAEEILEDLVLKSLLTKVKERDTYSNGQQQFEEETNCYGIHDILLDYLKDTVSDEKLKCMHIKLVENYLKLCKLEDGTGYDFRRLPNDDYIHTYLAHHLYKSGMCEFFPLIFLDLVFVESKLKQTGPADLIHDYSNYRNCFSEIDIQNERKRMDFERFIRQKAHLLSSSNDGCNIYQLALQEPCESEVYKRAVNLIQNTPITDRLFFKWCNSSESHNVTLLSAKPDSCVTDIVFSPDNNYLISVGEDKVIRFLETHSGRVFQEYSGHTDAINKCFISSSGDIIATASSDMTVRLWNVPKYSLGNKETSNGPTTPRPRSGSFPFSPTFKKERLIFTKHADCVLTCSFSKNEELVASGSADGIVFVWKTEDGEVVKSQEAHKLGVTSTFFSQDDKYLATSSLDSTIIVWKIDTWTRVQEYCHKGCPAVYCSFMNDGSLISAAGKLVCKWRIGQKDAVRSYNNLKTTYSITCCALSPTEQFVAGGTSRQYVVVWSTKSGYVHATLKGHCDTITCVHFSDDGNKLVSASSDGDIFVWDMQQASQVSIVSFTKEMSVLFRASVPLIAILNEVNSIQLFKNMTGKSKDCFDEETDEVTTCCLSPDCEYIFYGTKSGFINRYNIMQKNIEKILTCSLPAEDCSITEDGKTIVTLSSGIKQLGQEKALRYQVEKENFLQPTIDGSSFPVEGCSVTADGKIIASFSTGITQVVKCQVQNGALEQRAICSGSLPVEGCSVTADGIIIATVASGIVQIYDEKKALRYHILKGGLVQSTIHSSGLYLLSCYRDGTANIVDLQNYEEVIEIHHGSETVTTCDLTQCCKYFTTGSVDKCAKIWSVENGEFICSEEFSDCIRKCCFSPCGRYLAVGTDDGLIKVIMWRTQTSISVFEAHQMEGWVNDIHFSPDSKFLVSVSNSIKWWTLNGDLLGKFIAKGGEIKKIFCCPTFSVFVTVDNMGVLYILNRLLTNT